MGNPNNFRRSNPAARQAYGGKQRADTRNTAKRVALVFGIVLIGVVCLAWAGKVAAEQVVPLRVVIRGCWLTETNDVLNAIEFNGMQSVSGIRAAAHSYDFSGHRWLRGISIAQDSLSTALITVKEANPLLLLKINGDEYWLCDDGSAVARSQSEDSSPVFEAILRLPVVELDFADIQRVLDLTEPVLLAAAYCNELLPGTIRKIKISETGEFDLYDRNNLRIRLGEPTLLAEKIGALPKALRICEEDSTSLQYLDARDPRVFYQKWNEPINE